MYSPKPGALGQFENALFKGLSGKNGTVNEWKSKIVSFLIPGCEHSRMVTFFPIGYKWAMVKLLGPTFGCV